MTNGDLVREGQIELNRVMLALRYVNSQLTKDEVWGLASYSKCGTVEKDEDTQIKYVSFHQFFLGLLFALNETHQTFFERFD